MEIQVQRQKAAYEHHQERKAHKLQEESCQEYRSRSGASTDRTSNDSLDKQQKADLRRLMQVTQKRKRDWDRRELLKQRRLEREQKNDLTKHAQRVFEKVQ